MPPCVTRDFQTFPNFVLPGPPGSSVSTLINIVTPTIGAQQPAHAVMSTPGSRRLRSEYLKNGCKECKRRKIKCDEFRSAPPGAVRVINAQGRELCWQCTRLKKECEYPLKGERVARVLLKVLMEKEREDHASKLHQAALGGGSAATGGPPPAGLGVPHAYPGPMQLANGSHPARREPHVGAGPMHASAPGAGGFGPRYPNDQTHLPTLPYNMPPDYYSLPGQMTNHYGYMPAGPARGFPVVVAGGAGGSPGGAPALLRHALAVHPMLGMASGVGVGPEVPQFYDQADLLVLASDLNNLVSDMMYEANPDNKNLLEVELNPTPPTPTSDESSSLDSGKAHLNLNDWIPRNVGLGYIDVRQPQEMLFLQEFYLEFANVILPFNSYDRSLQAYFNPVRDILLKCASKEPFLLAAILAQGARSSYSKSGAAEDEEAYCQYLLRCLKLLGPALGHATGKNGLALTPNTEAVLLTVLLLTSSNAANTKQNWRPHLKGAKDLLIKQTTNGPHVRNSKVLVFCKYWFMSFELLAGLGLTLGGTIHLEEELALLLNTLDSNELQVLTELGLILPNGFNLIVGYHLDLINTMRDLIKSLNKVRRDKYYAADESAEYIRLLSEFHHHLNTHFVDKQPVLDMDKFPDRSIPDGLLLESVTVETKRMAISWMDISQRLYCLAGIITVMRNLLKITYDSPAVQDLVGQMTGLLSSILKSSESPLMIKHAIMMVQWPLLVAGLSAVKDSDRNLVTEFFASAAKVGAGSAGHSMNHLRRIWNKRDSGAVVDTDEESPVDIVNY